MEVKISSLHVVLSVCVVITSVTAVTRRSFGEECDKIHRCDKTAWLSCQDSKCNCSKPDEMLYDESKKTCVTKSGERCRYGLDESEESSLVEITECVPNANCSAEGVCLCDSKYHETENGTCGLSLSYGENCTEDQCSKYVGLHCADSKCQCKEGIYSLVKGLCVGLSQSNCIRDECVDGAICVQGKCLCDSQHFHSTKKSCLRKKSSNENCKRDSECLQTDTLKLRCISGKCNCPEKSAYSRVQKYEYSLYNRYKQGDGYKPFGGFIGPFVEICAPRIGEKCPDGFCTENAFCDAELQNAYSTSTSLGSCKCLDTTFSPNKHSEYCGKNYDQECTFDSDCIDDLVCSDGKCDCPSPSHQFFDSSTRTCITKVGGHCTNTSTCVKYSECQFLSSANISGHCRCENDFVVNENRQCDQIYGTACISGVSRCDTVAGLKCVNTRCSCPDTLHQYDSVIRKCLGLVGASCNDLQEQTTTVPRKWEHLKISCIENAYCDLVHPLLEGECKCKDGYQEADNHTCVNALKPSGKSVVCGSSEFQCADLTTCLAMELRCDGKNDCLDHSDETDCEADEVDGTIFYNSTCDMHTCENGQCISKEWLCDGIVHCDDNSDEKYCPEIPKMATEIVATVCQIENWTCRSGHCIDRSYFCNKRKDCLDGSDEPVGCESTECGNGFRCFGGNCINRSLLCNGIKDCPDGSDESICVM